MAYIVANRLEVSIIFNDTLEYPLTDQNVLNYLHIGCSTKARLPTFDMSITDTTNVLTRMNIANDATRVTIVIKALGNQRSTTYNFRTFNHLKRYTGNGYTWQIDGYYDAPLYWAGTSIAGYRGTSDAVLQQIAQRCGLKYSGVSTADSQLWMQQNKRYGEFVRYIVGRGYITNGSFMASGVDLDGTLRYVNVNKLPPAAINFVAKKYVEGCIPIVDYKGKSTAGYSNQNTGYYSSRNAQSLTSKQDSEVIDSLEFTPDVRSPAFNSNVRAAVGRGLQKYAAVDVGNTHENFERAIYQNERFSNLFSQQTEFMTQVPTDIPLFSKVAFSAEIGPNQPDEAYNGEYTIAARSLLIQGANYAEKLLGLRHGVNSRDV